MTARALICGSVAFDTAVSFEGRFHEYAAAAGGARALNACFRVPQPRREYGGCAGNIAYNMRFLGDCGAPMATVGADAAPYLEWMRRHGIPTERIAIVDRAYTAHAFATTDRDQNQITEFHPGAMDSAHVHGIGAAPGIELGVISSDCRDGMLRHAAELACAGIPFLFDPGRGLPMFDGDELRNFVHKAAWVAVNDREWHLLRERTGMSERQVAAQVHALVITHGAKGATIHAEGRRFEIPPARPSRIADPAGCRGAHRAGLLYGILHALDWPSAGRIASLMGAIKIEVRGAQNHRFTHSEFYTRYLQNFGTRLSLVRNSARPRDIRTP